MELQVGGIYASRDDNGRYSLTKVLALDDFAAHVRIYNETFDEVPADISSSRLSYFIGHAPIDRAGFTAEHKSLVLIEPVEDSELEGYRLYLEAMQDM